jgi:hypothetical protein
MRQMLFVVLLPDGTGRCAQSGEAPLIGGRCCGHALDCKFSPRIDWAVVAAAPRAEYGVAMARCAKVIRVACNQGVSNQWYQTTLVRSPFKGGPQDSRCQPEKTNSAHSYKYHMICLFLAYP